MRHFPSHHGTQAFPLRKLSTVHLIDVYKRINRKYYNNRHPPAGGAAGTTHKRPSPGTTPPTPPRGRFRSFPNHSGGGGGLVETDPAWQGLTGHAESRNILHDRYAVGRVIGKGSFARVVVGYDIVTDTRVALKVVRRSDAFHAQAAKELEILRALGGHAPAFDEGGDNTGGRTQAATATEGHPNVVSMLDAFVHRGGNQSQNQSQSQNAAPSLDGGFRCLVFELLSHSLYDVLRSTSFKGVSLGLVRKFARQIFSALSFLRSIGVVHCDVKPENVLLVSADRSAVKLIDFGSSCFVGDTPDFTYVQSRFYRAAEVILGLPYGVEIDTWSLGCVLVEMHAGTPLFPGRDERDQLGKIAEALGPVPAWMRERCPPEKRSVHYPHLVGAGQPGGGVDQHQHQSQHQNQVLTRSRSKSTGSAEGASFSHDGPHDGSTGPIPGSRPLRGVIAAAARKFELSRPGGGGGATGMDVDPTASLSFHTLGIDDGRREGDSLTGLSSSQTDVVLFCDLVERIVTWNPESRLSPDDALSHQFFGNEPAGTGGGSQPSSGGSGRRVSDAGFEMDFEMDLDDEAVARLGEFPAR